MKILTAIAYWTVRGLSKFFAHIVFPTKVNGLENAKIEDTYILCCNHLSIFDPIILVGAVLHKKAYFMGKAELYKTKIGNWFFRSLLSFPVVRGSADMSAVRSSISCLKGGTSMMIFPEGTRNVDKDGTLKEFHNGVGIIALNANCKIIPCYIDSKDGYRLFKKVRVNIGKPISLDNFKDKGINKENLVNIMNTLKKSMEELM